MISLRKIDTHNIWPIIKLHVRKEQESFVATNTESLLEAFATREEGLAAWPFGIYNDDTLVGFIMFGYDSSGDDEPAVAKGNYCIWRFMIDQNYQGCGYGRQALRQALEFLRRQPYGPARYCWLSYEPENTAAKKLYAAAGFIENGQKAEDEIVAVCNLQQGGFAI